MPGLMRLDNAQPRLEERDNTYALHMAAPGVSASDLSVEARDGRLMVKGETRGASHTHFVNYSVALPRDADADAATATCIDGLLTVELPKRAKAEPVRIAVSTDAEMEDEEDEGEAESDAPRPYK